MPKFRRSAVDREDEIGVAIGMAWTEFGGELLTFETSKVQGKGSFVLTGQLGAVMQESAQAAFSYVRAKVFELNIARDIAESFDIHIHVPEGAIPKEGPSAGITIAIAILSLLTEIPVSKKIVMSGEITLRGKVLPVGGIKEKLLAAHREGIRVAILPIDNKPDLKDLPKISRPGHDHPPGREHGRRPQARPDPGAAAEAGRTGRPARRLRGARGETPAGETAEDGEEGETPHEPPRTH